MRFLAFLEGTSGVRGFLVSDEGGEQRCLSGAGPMSAWTAPRTAVVARDLGLAGAIAGLGAFSAASVRSGQTSRLLAQSGELIALIDLDVTRATTDIEARLQETEWASAEPAVSKGTTPTASEHETLPPRAGPDAVGSSGAPAPATHAPAPVAPVAVPGPPRPFQGLPGIAGRAVPRPNGAAGAPSLRAVPAAASAPGRHRPPLPSRPGGATGAVALDAASDSTRGSATSEVEEPASTRPLESAATPSALLTGSLATFALPDLLEFLRVGQRSGTLVCASESGLGAIHLKRGRITGAASPGVPSIGDWLVQRGALSQERLHEALRHHTQSGTKTPLGGTLVTHKLVSREALQDALMVHVGAVLRKLMTWETGAFTFDPASAEATDGTGDVEIEPQSVLLNIFKEMDDSRRG